MMIQEKKPIEEIKKDISSMTPQEKMLMSYQMEMKKSMKSKMEQSGQEGVQPGGKKGLGAVPKAKNFKATLKRLIRYIGKLKGSVAIAVSCAVVASLCALFTPYMLARVLDVMQNRLLNQTDIDFHRIAWFLVILASLYLFNAIFSLIQNIVITAVTQKTLLQFRKDISFKIMRLPLGYFDRTANGDILSRVTNDIDTVGTSLQQVTTQAFSNLITILGSVVLMLMINPFLALICIVMIPLSIFSTKRIMKKSQTFFRTQAQSMGALNSIVEETFSGVSIIKQFGYEKQVITKFQKNNEALYQASKQAQFLSSTMNPVSTAFNNLAYMIICTLGAVFVIMGNLSLGGITALIQYQRQYSTPISQLANLLNAMQSGIAAAERVFELLDEEEEASNLLAVQTLEHVRGDIRFEHLKFGYSNDKMLMNDINVEVKAGQMVAIVGPTGAGKTTLINLLLRFYDINGGKITIDGVDIAAVPREEVRKHFGMVLQDTWLFHGSIRDNICYGKEQATQQELLETAKASQIDFFVSTMPQKYETEINESGSNISQGQKQLLTIGRAMIADPEILILDEATSSVDTRTEAMIQAAMEQLMQGRTSFVIAHRLSTIANADLIFVMKDGNIIEQGTHASLLKDNGLYADLYNSQFAHQ